MSKQIYSIDSYRFTEADAVLFDANIWLYLYSPQGKLYPRVRSIYNLAFRRIRGEKCPIFVDVLVLSEFINAYARFVYNDLPEGVKPANFKSFRNSADFKPVAEDIAKYTRRILEKSQRTEIGFQSLDLSAIMRDYATGEKDFNDQILAELCRTKGLKLVTHDADFQGEDLTIITGNQQLLR
ncbi:type II toxin-antitoxin system VapC family toxin [Aerosakkonema funiforme]|uniref:PIN domain-containing protein n=1 Tax=Aerosakkonema funiforme FACHB-1375 TaxID=2949571 RepID=A0A926VKK5_9CYAN|nr:PIN domain-containing protein [Aerosakkonema funiforme]MBD2184467.1 PIN domain-containing protein [Aerosakkonema funiforme FACHB-1375]